MRFYWWEDAIEAANTAAARTGKRQRVHRLGFTDPVTGSRPWLVTDVVRLAVVR